MIGFQATNQGIARSDGTVRTEPPFLEFLLEESGARHVVYDLDSTVASVLPLIGISPGEARKLNEHRKVDLHPYRLTYYPGRFFSVDKGRGPDHPYANFLNMGQYLDTRHDPQESPQTTVAKARAAVRTATVLVEDTLPYLKLPTEIPTSPIAAFKRQLELVNPPTIDDMPAEVAKLARWCRRGNFVEAFSLGHWDYAQDWDINSAYPACLAGLWDTRRGRWVKTKGPVDQAVYSFSEGYISTRAPLHPFIFRHETPSGDADLYTPWGRWHTYVTKAELDLLHDYNLGSFEPIQTWNWLPIGNQYHVYSGVVNWLYNKRQGTTGLRREFIRRIGAALWGKTLEFHEGEGELGPFFNPVVGALVESTVRVQVVKTCLDLGIMPLHCAVDGLVVDHPLPLTSSTALGQWRLSHEGPCLIASAGAVAFGGRERSAEFSLRYTQLLDMIHCSPRAREYKLTKFSPVTLALACHNGQTHRLGRIVKTTRPVTVGDNKRAWDQPPRTGGQLLRRRCTGQPLDVSMIAGPQLLLEGSGGRPPEALDN